MFDAKILPPSKLNQQFVLRPLHLDDYNLGFAKVLAMLTDIEGLNCATFKETYLKLETAKNYFVVVIEDTKKHLIVAAGTLLVEQKFIHNAGKIGHIEDIVSHSEYRGMNLGRAVIEALIAVSRHNKCYKTILDCSEKNVLYDLFRLNFTRNSALCAKRLRCLCILTRPNFDYLTPQGKK